MKTWIKQILRENLDEIAPKPKPIFGSGAFHNVYTSSKNPDKLYKMGRKRVVERWVNIFKRDEKYFPKVYRVFPSSKDPDIFIVEIEKLNTYRAAKELGELDMFLINISDSVHCNDEFIHSLNFFEGPCFEKVISAANMTNKPQLVPILYKWAKFLTGVKRVIGDDLRRELDLHAGNVAYDNNGNLKMIDI